MADKEFFIRKAIGWALRQYAWTDPKEVRRYVKANKARLSPLSVREALKNYDENSSLRTRSRSRSI
jgi:3-methyladenine DNA glycosylase AlkD